MVIILMLTTMLIGRTSQEARCATGQVITQVDNKAGVLSIVCHRHEACDGFNKTATCATTLVEECSVGQWMVGIQRDQSTSEYPKLCCSHPLLDDTANRPLIALSPNDQWKGDIYRDEKGRGFVDVPIGVERIFGHDFYISLRQVRCRPPPPPANQVSAKLPERPGFRKVKIRKKSGETVSIAIATCFLANVTIQTINGPKQMNQVTIGDRVLTLGNGGMLDYRPVLFFIHRDHQLVATFIHIETMTGQRISLSPKHLIYRFDCHDFRPWQFNFRNVDNLAFADEIIVGDCVGVARPGNEGIDVDRVKTISSHISVGVFSPVTDSGVIVASNVVASCYSQSKDVQAMKTWFHRGYRFISTWKSYLPVKLRNFLLPLSSSFVALPNYVDFVLNYLPVFSIV